jgi:biopolymer transport protein ExbD
MRHGWIAVSLAALVACSGKDSSTPAGEGTGGGSAPVAAPSIPAGPVPVALPTAEAKHARKVQAAGAFVTVKADGAVAFGKLAPGPAPYEGMKRTPDPLGKQVAGLDDPPPPPPPPSPDGPPPPDPDPPARAQGQYKMRRNDPDYLARQQAIDAARQAGVLGTLQQGGSFASLTGTADFDSGFGDLLADAWAYATLEPIGTTDVVVLADAAARGDAVAGVLAELSDERAVVAIAGASAPDALVYRFGQIAADKHPLVVMTVTVAGMGATLQGLVAAEQSFPAPFPGRADQPALARALAAVPDPANSAVEIRPGEDATWQQVVDVLAAAAAAKYGAVTLAASTMRGGFGWGTIGTGRYGTIGQGSGTGYGVGGRRSNGPSVTIGQPNSQGDLDKAIIRRYIKRNIQKIQYCYEKQLLVKPGIEGTVSTQFFIRPDGKVETATARGVDTEVASCVADVIERIEFPKPRGGGGVQVNYPFTFREAP